MYRLAWQNSRLDSTAPFFYNTPDGMEYLTTIESLKENNPDLYIDHQVFDFEDRYIIVWLFENENKFNQWHKKMLEIDQDFVIKRDKYISDNNQNLFVIITDEKNEERTVNLVPKFGYDIL